MTEQEVYEQHEQDRQRMAETRRLVQEAAALDNRTIPFTTIEWLDTHQRRHIGPYDTSGKHNQLGIDCWCDPSLWKDVIIHWEDEPQQCLVGGHNQPCI